VNPDYEPDWDPRIAGIRRAFEARAAARAERASGWREAAVALLLRPRDTLEVLLIRRADLPGDPWSGHVALPGGRREISDADLLDTACRETEEEVGVPLGRIGRFIGALDEIAPSTPRLPPILVAPFVLAVPPDTTAIPAPREVQAAFWLPLHLLRDESAASEILIEADGARFRFPSVVFGDYVIWGLTYRILRQFLAVVEGG
jgi:8-oxo-dGTP pyrophosphatase MutT (NUDIX family)